MKKINRKCIVCGTEYSYCPRCSEDAKLEPWHTIYESENCKEIFGIASDFLAGDLTKEKAKLAFNKCDLSNKSTFNKTILNAIETACVEEKVYDKKTESKISKETVVNK